jgi:glycosyltransferase involved in cell wall biosynthesis
MRILYFSRDFTTHDHRFLSALAESAHQVFFLRLERQGRQLEDRPLPAAIEQVAWAGGQAPARWQDGPRLLASLKQVIRSIKPDIIQAGPIQRSAFLTALAGFQPLVSMSWGYDLIHDAHQNGWLRWATRYTLKRSALMLGDCDTIRHLATSFGMPDERILTFPWGIDLEHFAPRKDQPDPQDVFTLLSTRSWEALLGVDIIAQAFVQVAQQRSDVRLIMAGGGSLAPKLRQIFLRHGLITEQPETGSAESFPRLIFPGQIGYADLPRLYHSADLYIAATHSDGSSISLLEAMACGRPALVSDIPGNQEWIEPGKNGWLFPDSDASALANAILHAIENRHKLLDMGQAARKTVEQRADWKQNFPRLLKAYETL